MPSPVLGIVAKSKILDLWQTNCYRRAIVTLVSSQRMTLLSASLRIKRGRERERLIFIKEIAQVGIFHLELKFMSYLFSASPLSLIIIIILSILISSVLLFTLMHSPGPRAKRESWWLTIRNPITFLIEELIHVLRCNPS